MFFLGMSSSCSDKEIQWNMKYYDMKGIWARPLSMMRPYLFNYDGNFRIPDMVTSPKLVPLYPFIRKVIKMYDVVPIQLSLNSYKLFIALFIIYLDLKFPTPTMKEVSHFFSLRKSDNGYYYLVDDKKYNKKGFSAGKFSHEKQWKEPFFYLYVVPRVRFRFNTNPSKDVPSFCIKYFLT